MSTREMLWWLMAIIAIWVVGDIIISTHRAKFMRGIKPERRCKNNKPRWRMVVRSISRLDGTVFYMVQKRVLFGWRTYGDTLTRSEAESAINEIVSGVEAKLK